MEGSTEGGAKNSKDMLTFKMAAIQSVPSFGNITVTDFHLAVAA